MFLTCYVTWPMTIWFQFTAHNSITTQCALNTDEFENFQPSVFEILSTSLDHCQMKTHGSHTKLQRSYSAFLYYKMLWPRSSFSHFCYTFKECLRFDRGEAPFNIWNCSKDQPSAINFSHSGFAQVVFKISQISRTPLNFRINTTCFPFSYVMQTYI